MNFIDKYGPVVLVWGTFWISILIVVYVLIVSPVKIRSQRKKSRTKGVPYLRLVETKSKEKSC